MKKLAAVVAVAIMMILSYVAGRRHTAHAPAQDTSARRVLYWVDPMHPDYRSDHAGVAPDCGMALEPVYAENTSARAESAVPVSQGLVGIDSARQQLFGIRVAAVEKTPARENIRVLGRIVPEDTRIYRIDAGMDGFVRETFNDSIGALVKKDQKLATCYGSDSLSVASGFLAASASVPGSTGKDGSRTVPFPGAVSKQGVSSLQGYTDRLRNLGMSDAQIKAMAENRQLPESVDVVSPVEGFILSRNISAGQHFDRSMEFYRVADLSRVWIVADIFASDAQNFRPGTVARVALSGEGRALPLASPRFCRKSILPREPSNCVWRPSIPALLCVRKCSSMSNCRLHFQQVLPFQWMRSSIRDVSSAYLSSAGTECSSRDACKRAGGLATAFRWCGDYPKASASLALEPSWWIRRAGSSPATLRPRSRQARRHLHRPCAQMVWRLAPAKSKILLAG